MSVTVSQKTNSERGTVLGGEKHKLSFGYVKFEAFICHAKGRLSGLEHRKEA